MATTTGGDISEEGGCSSTTVAPGPVSEGSSTSPLNAATLKSMRHKAKYTVMKLEKKLEVLDRQIRRFNEEELSLDDMLSGSSAYMQEDLLKRKFVHSWHKLCDIVGISPEIEIVHEDGHYSETPYPEINRRVKRLLARDEFPDHFDICELIERCNTKHNLGISAEEKAQLSRKVFKSVGKILKSRRQKDFKQHFGSHLTDKAKDNEDPALTDQSLLEQLKTSVKDGQMRLEQMCEEFVLKQEQDSGAGQSPEADSCSSDNEEEEEEEEGGEIEIEGLEDDEVDIDSELVAPEGAVSEEPPLLKKRKLISSEDQLLPDSPELQPAVTTTVPSETESEVVTSTDPKPNGFSPNSSNSSSIIDVGTYSEASAVDTTLPSSSLAPVICLSDDSSGGEDSDVVIVSD